MSYNTVNVTELIAQTSITELMRKLLNIKHSVDLWHSRRVSDALARLF